MYQEEVADLTAAHLRTHLQAYLNEVAAKYPDSVKLLFPKSIETNNLVGGVYTTGPENMPAYAVDIVSEVFSTFGEDLWMYNYDGHIAGVVAGADEQAVNQACKRHEQAVELFIKRHEHFHQTPSALGNDFRIIQLGFSGAAFSGAELIDEENDRQTWIAGFRIDLLWVISEDGPGDHS